MNSCPSGYSFGCKDFDGNYYFYEGWEGSSCSDFGMTPITPNSSSSASRSSASIGSGACYDEEYGFCMEHKMETMTRSECTSYYEGTYMNSCPSGRKCEDEYDIYYFYDSMWDDYTCDEILYVPDEMNFKAKKIKLKFFK